MDAADGKHSDARELPVRVHACRRLTECHVALAWHAIAAGVAGSSAAGEFPKLPKRYAPLAGGEVPARELLPGLPLPSQRAVWLVACAAAIAFWQAAAGDRRIGKDFRAICAGNADELMRLRDRL